ncbi:hypothetical protein T265_06325 [Opisthorchis viverrini]|uniref:Uncharacterized protein n=1 Tax=Opisthorchis viverrini TaxID=6198 RepID=A0A075ADZ8_OPIVI|nr:hypothetical protein T265_06325 [Opisthorchis viverrini]KER26404.1 hypothetical protein T265_06325 [Opisthorchis viverrini]
MWAIQCILDSGGSIDLRAAECDVIDGPALGTDDSVRPTSVPQATSARHPAATSSGIWKSICMLRRPI